MNPRLKTSKKSTAIPKDYIKQIEGVFAANFKPQLKGAKVSAEGRIYPDELALRVAFGEKGKLTQANFTVSINYNKKKPDIVDKIHLCIDAIASIMTDFFDQGEEPDMPRHWQEFTFNKEQIFFQYSTENTDLEAQANALLGENDANLISEEEETLDALDIAEVDNEKDPTKH